MKKYLAVFVAPIEAYDKMKADMANKSAEQRKQKMEAWKMWMEQHKAYIADYGGGVGGAKRVSDDGTISDARNEIGGYMIIQADSADEAARIFTDSPHFSVKGGGVDVMEIMQM